ncbi:CPBP family intramembrane glutamic endopeptidase [Actinomyces israelii]
MNSSSDPASSGTGTAAPALLGAAVPVAPDAAAVPDAAVPVVGTPWSRLVLAMGVRPALVIVFGAVLWAVGRPLVWMNVLIVVIDVVTLVLVHRLLRAEGRGLTDLLSFRGADVGWGLLCGLIVLVAWVPAFLIGNLVAYQGAPPASSYPPVPLWIGVLSVTIMPVTIGLAEEALYRGYLQPRLQGRIGLVGAVLAACAVFGLQHIGFALPDAQAMVASVVRTFLAGLVFAWLLTWRKRVAPLAVGHWLIDLLGLGLPVLIWSLQQGW